MGKSYAQFKSVGGDALKGERDAGSRLAGNTTQARLGFRSLLNAVDSAFCLVVVTVII